MIGSRVTAWWWSRTSSTRRLSRRRAPTLGRRGSRELGLEPNAVVVGIVASLLPIKDHATLLRAVALLLPGWPAAAAGRRRPGPGAEAAARARLTSSGSPMPCVSRGYARRSQAFTFCSTSPC